MYLLPVYSLFGFLPLFLGGASLSALDIAPVVVTVFFTGFFTSAASTVVGAEGGSHHFLVVSSPLPVTLEVVLPRYFHRYVFGRHTGI